MTLTMTSKPQPYQKQQKYRIPVGCIILTSSTTESDSKKYHWRDAFGEVCWLVCDHASLARPINSSHSNVCSGLAVQFQLHQKTQVQTSKISSLVLKTRMIVLGIEIVQKSPHSTNISNTVVLKLCTIVHR